MKKITSSLLLIFLCSMGYSQSCPSNLTFSSPEYASWQVYSVSSVITTQYGYYVGPGQNITLKAANFVVLKPDSAIISDSEFVAKIGDCGSPDKVATLQDNTIQKLIASPNPTNSLITVSGMEINQISLFDILGKQVFTENYNGSDTITVDMGNFQNGIYLLTVSGTNGSSETHKIIKN